jgi:carbonic anhydrase
MPYTVSIAQEVMTPSKALQNLKEGNFRFINNLSINRDLLNLVAETKDEQKPFAVILSCMDSRVSSELVFDQGLGDIFSVRVAGNVISSSVLGSLEYATAVAGSKLILVLGHTNCGAIKGACDNVKLDHVSHVLQKIQPAIMMEQTVKENRTSSNPDFVYAVTKLNVKFSITELLQRSNIIRSMAEEGTIRIVPAIYDVATGRVEFSEFDPAGN